MSLLPFYADIPIVPFLEAVTACTGAVELRTPDGDVLNLKSELSRYLLVAVLAKPDLLQGAYIVCEDADQNRLHPFLVREEKP